MNSDVATPTVERDTRRAAPRLRQRTARRIRWGLLWLAVSVVVAGGAGAAYEAAMAAGDAERYPPPGRLVAVDGRRLHLDCAGDGAPTVVLVTGLGGASLLWDRVQPALAAVARTCAYDRTGIGWSEAGAPPRTPTHVAAELRALLANAGVPGPYVLVGASVGGKYARLYAEAYPDEVAGLVLVDARHESVDAALTPEERAAALAGARRDGRLYWLLGRLGIMRLAGDRLAAALSPGAAALPAETRRLLMTRAARLQEIEAMLGEAADMTADDDRLRAARLLGDLPLAVLAAEESVARSPEWRAGQVAQARLSTAGQLVVVPDSGHLLALDQPAAVVAAVWGVVAAARGAGELCRAPPWPWSARGGPPARGRPCVG